MHTYFRAIARPEQLHLAETLDRHIKVDGDCWVYDGALNHNGYAIMSLGGKKVARAHRVAYELANGPIPGGLHVDHVRERGCTSRACCKPAHLEAVDQPENNRRAAAWRRARKAGAVVAIATALTVGASTAAAAHNGGGGSEYQAVICHRPGTPAEQTLFISKSALDAHLKHGDTKGPCRPKPTQMPEPTPEPSVEPTPTSEPTTTPAPSPDPTAKPTTAPTPPPTTTPTETPSLPPVIGTPVTPDVAKPRRVHELAETGFDPLWLWVGLGGIVLVGGGTVMLAGGASKRTADSDVTWKAGR